MVTTTPGSLSSHDNSDDEQTIARLEQELASLRSNYEEELERSWADVERLEQENHFKGVKLEDLENACMDLEDRCQGLELLWKEHAEVERQKVTKIEDLEQECVDLKEKCRAFEELREQQAAVDARRPSNEKTAAHRVPMKPVHESTWKDSTDANDMGIGAPPTEEVPIRRRAQRVSSLPTMGCSIRDTSHPEMETKAVRTRKSVDLSISSFPTLKNEPVKFAEPKSLPSMGYLPSTSMLPTKRFAWSTRNPSNDYTKQEQGLLHQLKLLEEEKDYEALELKLKLTQREAAIETLEQALTLKGEYMEDLRTEMANIQAELLLSSSNKNPADQSVIDSIATSRKSSSSKMQRRMSMGAGNMVEQRRSGEERRRRSGEDHRRRSGGSQTRRKPY